MQATITDAVGAFSPYLTDHGRDLLARAMTDIDEVQTAIAYQTATYKAATSSRTRLLCVHDVTAILKGVVAPTCCYCDGPADVSEWTEPENPQQNYGSTCAACRLIEEA